jgi:hypothetical protein
LFGLRSRCVFPNHHKPPLQMPILVLQRDYYDQKGAFPRTVTTTVYVISIPDIHMVRPTDPFRAQPGRFREPARRSRRRFGRSSCVSPRKPVLGGARLAAGGKQGGGIECWGPRFRGSENSRGYH